MTLDTLGSATSFDGFFLPLQHDMVVYDGNNVQDMHYINRFPLGTARQLAVAVELLLRELGQTDAIVEMVACPALAD